ENDIRPQRIERGVARNREPVELKGEDRGLEPSSSRHPGSDREASRPADQERPWVEPARVQPKDHGRDCLTDPDAAKKLQLDRILQWQEDNENERTHFDYQRDQFGILRFLRGRTARMDEGDINVAREQV